MSALKFTDRVSIGQTKDTKEGYLVATARVARTGTQLYLASELGSIATDAGFKPTDVVRVYRHEDQVFDKASLDTITRLPVTVNHPSEEVTAANWGKYSVGEVGDAYATEPEWIVVNPMVKDSGAVQAARTTHQEISMGYRAEIVKARDGLDADFEQIGIRYNHLALVPKGRAGDLARIGDSWGASPVQDYQPGTPPTAASKGKQMSDPTTKPVVVDNKVVHVALSDVAIIDRFVADTAQRLKDLQATHAAEIAARDTQIGTLQGELKIAQDKAVIDIDGLVADRTALVSQVQAIDAKIDPKGKTAAQLRAAAVVSRMGDKAIAGASEAVIDGMFRALSATSVVVDQVGHAIQRGVQIAVGGDAQAMHDAEKKSKEDLNAWRKNAK